MEGGRTLEIRIGATCHGEVTVYVGGHLDLNRADDVRDMLITACGLPAVRRCRVDLGGVTFLDSAGLGALVAARHQAGDNGVRMYVVNPAPPVAAVLEITGTHAYLTTP
jgi:anti-anti-sigma factor